MTGWARWLPRSRPRRYSTRPTAGKIDRSGLAGVGEDGGRQS